VTPDSLQYLISDLFETNILFENNGDLDFKNISNLVGLSEPTFSNGCVLEDLDNDGDLDVVISNIDQIALIYENNASELNNYLSIQLDGPHQGLHSKIMTYIKKGIVLQ